MCCRIFNSAILFMDFDPVRDGTAFHTGDDDDIYMLWRKRRRVVTCVPAFLEPITTTFFIIAKGL
jgi:hypothetical protein